MAALLYITAAVLGLATAVMEIRSHRRVRAAPADQARPVRYLTERDPR
ncbi:hypothetical protein BX265_5003 [Streptomyces sp. TLI_235]|nr:hypothetical protein [Streptomyces sp. TLI_235]PBC72221.1 hypothetical protein BX265_6843 [Streptomyces sp. TLI_235]PBC80166.1 hypothetical protein BX265_5003 [Streptomyces sp. TLI_235]